MKPSVLTSGIRSCILSYIKQNSLLFIRRSNIMELALYL